VSASSSASWWAWPEGWPRTPRGIARRVLAEFIGTALPLAAIVGSGIAADRLSPGDAGVQLLINAAVTGAALVAILLAVGPVSGAHLSPVVTLADRAFGGVSRGLTAAYVAAQFAGAGAGVMLATLALPATDLSSTKRLDRGLWLGEAVATFGLVLVAFGIVRSRRTQLARRICAASYRKARPDVRKMSNRAFFRSIRVRDGTIADFTYEEALRVPPRFTQWLDRGDERTRTADPLLAKHGLVNSLTRGFVSSAGHGRDSGEVERRKVRQ